MTARRFGGYALTILPIWVYAALSIAWKSNCFGPEYGPLGETLGLDMRRIGQYLCGTDIQVMWDNRGLALHIFPYIFGSFDPPATLSGGTVEYPVFTGLFMWMTALLANNGFQFLIVTTIFMAIAATFTAILLRSMVGNWVFFFVLAPATFLYMAYNWDMLPVLCTVLGVWVVIKGPSRWSNTTRVVIAAVLFGVGALFKLYPILFLLPLGFWALTGFGLNAKPLARKNLRWADGLRPVWVGGLTFVMGNIPFALLGFNGWLASFQFQGKRFITSDTLSMWWWFMYPIFRQPGITNRWLAPVTTLATLLALAGVIYAMWLGARIYKKYGNFPWLQIAAACLTAYLLLNKVHSLQYALWILPFFVLIAIPTWQIVTYLLIDLGLFLSWFGSVYWALTDDTVKIFWFAVAGFVYLRIGMLIVLFFSFAKAPVREMSLRFSEPDSRKIALVAQESTR